MLQFIKKLLPPTRRHFDGEIDGLKNKLAALGKSAAQLNAGQDNAGRSLAGIREQVNALERQLAGQTALLEKILAETQAAAQAESLASGEISRTAREVLWANTFNSVARPGEWLGEQSFAPGRWAVGYPYLYLLYRVLNEFSPRNILELGMGQTTKMISPYAVHFKAVHDLVEHDERWIAFFNQRENVLTGQTRLVKLDLVERSFLDDDKVTAYGDFAATFAGRKYDLLSIDGPFGGKALKYARIDTLELMPDCLCDSFVIMIDDYNRSGEQNTAVLIRKKLKEHDIPFSSCVFHGEKDVCMITSRDNHFLCSM